MLSAIIHAFILAIGLILPLGVQNFFVFSQGAVREKWIYVLPVVLTASICDSVLILVAVLGLSVVVLSFVWMKTILVVGGTIFLLYMGYMSWRTKPEGDKQVPQHTHTGKLISFTMMISILNPHAILDTVGVIGTSSLSYSGYEKIAFTLTCIVVSWTWFFLLALAGRLVGVKDKKGKLIPYLNKVSAIVMWAAAIYLVTTL
ncbi:LysE/ArgO family amino acid transporter [Paenibacillus sedimenti]|uniref:Amino acid transporter n=1 Tax=Paenibacillus sedimenti TaxID=2770274 RepID=A0A926KS35_9BACL|nr:LysE/ArgO family amino acid transporter [Paenibacillus sedimenti]MBD0382507.1 amino acid transporter [Paenibacillus sedimenti]